MKAKKIILFIVEGITDRTCLGFVLDKLLSNQLVRFAITGGDITTKTGNNTSNIVAKIGNIIRDFSGNVFTAKDFFEVVHLVDMDGAYISPDKVISSEYDAPFYTDDNILTNNVEGILRRNRQKVEILNRLISLNKVKTIPYSVYYFSCNLDHVIHNHPNLTRREKNQYANKFEDRFITCPEKFLDFLNNHDFAVEGDYDDTWSFIKIDKRSLQRVTNFQLYFKRSKNSRNDLEKRLAV